MKRLVLDEMTWTEVNKELDNIEIAIIPVGSCEQHGPNTTFSTDTVRAYEFCKLLGEKMGNKLLIFPPVGYGISVHHMGFPTTVTLRIETMIAMLIDIAVSINKHGIKKILFINGHGGNRSVLDSVLVKLKYEYKIETYWSGMGTNISIEKLRKEYDIPNVIGHACEIETSQSMYLAPWIVRDELKAGVLHEHSPYFRQIFRDGNAAWDWKNDVSENGALGDARKSSVEVGKIMTDTALEYLEEIINEIISR